MAAYLGSFQGVCQSVSFPFCSLGIPAFAAFLFHSFVVGPQPSGYQPSCYARNIDIAGYLVFQPGTLILLLVAMIMTIVMIVGVKSKYTAVGRKEFALFLYLYLALVLLEFLLEGNLIAMSLQVYPYFAAVHVGLLDAVFWCLLLNGFVGFQFAEDGTALSLWSFRISSLLVALLGFMIAILTFNGQPGSALSPTNQVALWIMVYVLPAAMFIIYVVLQVILIVNTLEDRWPLGDLAFGVLFFLLGQVFMMIISPYICTATSHYVDGQFFGTICNLLSVMMVYKYWDSITKEDLEFSVGGKLNVWEVKDDYVPQQGFKVFGYQSLGMEEDEFASPAWNTGSRAGSMVGSKEAGYRYT